MTGKARAEFGPGGEVVFVNVGTPVVEAAALAGIQLQTPCGGRGRCARCRIIAASSDGLTLPDEVERTSLSADELAQGVRLGCRAKIIADTHIWIPPASRLSGDAILEAGLVEGITPQPNVHCTTLSLSEPTLSDQRADLRRILAGLGIESGDNGTELSLLRDLPTRLRETNYQPIAVAVGDRLVDLRTPGTLEHVYGCAVDIGTTTVVAYLVELESGKVLGTGSAPNPQGTHGADVVSRVEFADSGSNGLATLHEEAITVVNQVIAAACAEANVLVDDVYEITVVGNACMMHLFVGVTPRYIARAPYIPAFDQPLQLSAAELALHINPRAQVYVLPNIAGWVGADTVGVLLSTRLTQSAAPTLAVDIGTNGEVMLWSGQQLLVCSTAAGPAFEGAQIRHGMRAAAGAIAHVHATQDGLALQTIGNLPPVGICGSGLLDAVAELLDLGVINSSGLMLEAAALESLSPTLASRLQGHGQQREFVLARPEESGTGKAITLTQADVRQLQLAKGAIRAGIEVLLAESGLQAVDLERILLAGAFGSYIDRVSAVRIGLVPELPLPRIVSVGNAAGAGAVMALISLAERHRAAELAETAKHVELSTRSDFQRLFMETMLFEAS
ncbi:MAG: ASKHA domain-containing protein [Candidatus Zipacnadales bacterium]